MSVQLMAVRFFFAVLCESTFPSFLLSLGFEAAKRSPSRIYGLSGAAWGFGSCLDGRAFGSPATAPPGAERPAHGPAASYEVKT